MAQIVRKLTEAEARDLLARGHVGRFAYAHNNEIDIRPMRYERFAEGDLSTARKIL